MSKEELLSKAKDNITIVTIVAFCVLALATILIGALALKAGFVPVCFMILIEAAIAALLHNAELWIHGVLVLAELIAGIICGKALLIVLCIVIYVAATYALKLINSES